MLRSNRVIQAIERNPDALWRLTASKMPAAEYAVANGVALTALGLPHYMFNFASLARPEPGAEDLAIANAIRFFEGKGLPWAWQIGPASGPTDLGERLVAAGLVHSHSTPGMGIDLRHYSAPPVDVLEVVDETSLGTWVEAALAAFGMPSEFAVMFTALYSPDNSQPIRYFYAVEDGKAVSTSMVFYGAGVAGIYCVGTIPEARKRGHGEKVMHACMQAALGDGYDVAILHSSRMGFPLYERLGFKEYCKIDYYLPASPIS